jgi:hypothetical protein
MDNAPEGERPEHDGTTNDRTLDSQQGSRPAADAPGPTLKSPQLVTVLAVMITTIITVLVLAHNAAIGTLPATVAAFTGLLGALAALIVALNNASRAEGRRDLPAGGRAVPARPRRTPRPVGEGRGEPGRREVRRPGSS